MEESLLRTNFLGRDGFIWWVGQIPPVDAWLEQANGEGWGNRYKVRIMGYHPYNTNELADEDLPWAGVILPPGNTGSAGVSKSCKFQPGDIVLGFFMDGENAQQPMIFGCFGNTRYAAKDGEERPFGDFTGFTNQIPRPSAGVVSADESNDPSVESKPSPRHLSPKDAAQVDPSNPASMSSAEGAVIILPSKEKNAVDKIQSAVEDFSNFLQNTIAQFDAGLDFVKQWIDNEIVQRVEKVVSATTGLVGGMINNLYEKLIPILQKGLEMLYQSVFKLTVAATGNPAAAHLAGVAAQKAMGIPVKAMQEFIPCVVNSVLGKIEDLASTVLRSVADNVTNFVECAADQSVGVIVNGVIGFVDQGLKPLLDGIQKILQFVGGFSIEGLLREGIDALSGIIGFASCNKPQKSSSAPKKYMIGFGPVDGGKPNLGRIMESANVAAGMAKAGQEAFSLISGTISQLDNTGQAIGECYAGPPVSCSPPTIDIFGGGGFGVEANLIMGGLTPAGTAGIIGVEVIDGGSGYTAPPFVQIQDNCRQGYGAVARATIKDGSVDKIYIVSEGENYPPADIIPRVVTDVAVINPGNGYADDDTVIDDLGNEYDVEIFDGSIFKVTPININDITDLPRLRVLTKTGSGAKLYPTLGERPTGELQQVIDCVT